MITKIEALPRQTIYDLALEHYGSVEGVFELVSRNRLSLDDTLEAGTIIEIDSDKVIDRDVVEFYKNRELKPANGQEIEDTGSIISAFTNGFKQNAVN